jgi:hypothetical protein
MRLWTASKQERSYNFVMGVLLPASSFLSIGRFVLTEADAIFRLMFLACLVVCTAVSTGLAGQCLYPGIGNRNWVRFLVRAGVFIWATVAVFSSVLTVGLAPVASILLSGLIKLGAKAIEPLYAESSRFTLSQLFWLTTLAALLFAAVAPLIRSIDDPSTIPIFVEFFIVLATPMLAAVAFTSVSHELRDFATH